MTRILLLATTLVLVAAPAAGASSLADVPLSGPQSVAVLQRLGIDVTHDVTRERARVVIHDEADRRTLADAGFNAVDVVSDVEGALRRQSSRARAGERSALPSGRDVYRVLQTYYDDLEALAQQYPGLVRKVTLGKKSIEGREIVGVEMASNVNAPDDGRPQIAYFGLHHAREWPSGEVNMEFALDLAKNYGKDPRMTAILDHTRLFIFPVVNPDGFVVSRGTTEAAPGGADPMHRRNCRPATPEEEDLPCSQRNPVDLNRNYGAGWGGPGASSDNTSDSYRGTGPFSEPEAQAVHEFSRVHQLQHVQSTHNIVGQVLRQPGFKDYGLFTPDEGIMKALGDKMAAATDYDSLVGYDLYDVHGATEDWNYIEQGAMGYTIELGPPDTPSSGAPGAGNAPLFFGPFQTHVVDQYLGGPTGGPAGQGIREAFQLAAEQAANAADHGVLNGSARPGATLRLHKDFTTDTVKRCADTSDCPEESRLPELRVPDFIDTAITVPPSGSFSWHVGPSTRPWEGAAGKTESWTLTCEVGGDVLARRDIVVTRGERLTFSDACDAGARVMADEPLRGGPEPVAVPKPPRNMRLFVGPRRVPRFALQRRGYLRVAMKVSGATVTQLRVRLVDADRVVLASRSIKRLRGPKAVRLRLKRIPPRGLYRLSLRGTADNGAPVGSAVRLRIR
ncbi:MAG TPA: M14 family zinc carboxypeptidase [Solirubrobacteraceae bacterium]|jgi:murein tripeptide amidase MpaA